jgi:hypothetical protein
VQYCRFSQSPSFADTAANRKPRNRDEEVEVMSPQQEALHKLGIGNDKLRRARAAPVLRKSSTKERSRRYSPITTRKLGRSLNSLPSLLLEADLLCTPKCLNSL